MKVAFEAICLHGPFHGDVHAGNIWLLDDGRAAYLDFGLMGELPDRWKSLMIDLLKTTQIDNNWARVVRNYKEVGVLSEDVGTDEEVGARLRDDDAADARLDRRRRSTSPRCSSSRSRSPSRWAPTRRKS